MPGIGKIGTIKETGVDCGVRIAMILAAGIQEHILHPGYIGQETHGHGMEIGQHSQIVLRIDNVHFTF